jgi:GT2 family glycosyltransferase
MKFSIVIPCLNHLRYTVEAVESVVKHTEDFELIVVDGGSTDGTWAWVHNFRLPDHAFTPLSLKEHPGFPTQANAGLKVAKGDFLILLNNDVVVTPRWAELLSQAITEGAEKVAVDRVGLAGPLSNSVAGRQAYLQASYTAETLDQFAVTHAADNEGAVFLTGFLSGFCLMISRECFQDVGLLDETFNPGGFEDNKLILTAEAMGWRGVIAPAAFVHHHGSKTIGAPPFTHMQGGLANRQQFYDMFADPKPKKLIAAFRVRNCERTLPVALDSAATYADQIVVLCDRCTDDTPRVAEAHPAVVEMFHSQTEYNELQDRATLLTLAKKHDPDWIIVLDHDETLETRFDKAYAQRLMHPPNPHVKAYGFWWTTFWDSPEQYRTDGIFGQIHGFRMFKNEPGQILAASDPLGFHMGSIPQFAPENFRWTNIRVLHTGYIDLQERRRKHAFYTGTDQRKDPMGIGADNYDHLIAEQVTVKRWTPTHSLAFVIVVKDEYNPLAEHLDTVSYVADQIIVIPTEDNDRIRTLAEAYGAEVHPYAFQNDYSKLRQFAKSHARTDWIFTCDPDEAVDPQFIEQLPKLIEVEEHGYLVTITNFRPNETPTTLDSIRLFRNYPAFRYRGIVHEQFDEAVRTHNLKILPCPFGLQHFGWLRNADSYRAKMALYKKLNRAQLQRYPDDKLAMFNMALHEMDEDHFTKAHTLLTKAASLDPIYFPPRVQLTVLHLRQARRFMQEALAILPADHRLRPEMTTALQHIDQALV